MSDYFSQVKSSLQNSGANWAYQDTTVGSDEIRRFEVRPGDHWRASDGTKERSEISSGEKLQFGQVYTLSYGFMVEPGAINTEDNVKVGQLHGTPDADDSDNLGPVFALQLDGEKMRIVVRSDANAVSADRTADNFVYTDKNDLVQGHWYNIQIVFKLDPKGGGELEVWRDGVQIADYHGALGYNDAVGPYWKEGIYRAGGSDNVTMAVDFKDTTLVKGDTVHAAPTTTTTTASTSASVSSSSSSSASASPSAPSTASSTSAAAASTAAAATNSDAGGTHAAAATATAPAPAPSPSQQAGYTTQVDNLLRVSPTDPALGDTASPIYAQVQAEKAIAAQLDAGQLSAADAQTALFHLVDGTTSVAEISYAFFTGKTPTQAGLNYLVHSSANPTDLNDAYYAKFTVENRYINFGVNLGTGSGAGAAAFQDAYGSLSLSDATSKAYAAIFGTAPAAGKVDAILNAQVADGLGGTETRAQYLADISGGTTIAQKAAMVGFLLADSVKEGLGPYQQADQLFLEGLAHGAAAYGIDLLAAHAPALVGQPTADLSLTG